MEEIAESALKHADTMTTRITIRKDLMNVQVQQNTPPYEVLVSQDYEVISKTEDSIDALDHIFGDALVALESLTAVKQNEDSSLNTK